MIIKLLKKEYLQKSLMMDPVHCLLESQLLYLLKRDKMFKNLVILLSNQHHQLHNQLQKPQKFNKLNKKPKLKLYLNHQLHHQVKDYL